MSARSQTGAVRRRLDADRWHFQHGPIDCIVSATRADSKRLGVVGGSRA